MTQLLVATLFEIQAHLPRGSFIIHFKSAYLFIKREEVYIYLAREGVKYWSEPHVPSVRTEYYFGFESIQCPILGCVSTCMNREKRKRMHSHAIKILRDRESSHRGKHAQTRPGANIIEL